MKLFSVDSAIYASTSGMIVLSITADIDDGNGTVCGIPYGWSASIRDPHGLYPQVDAWMTANPEFPIAPYVAPIIAASEVTQEAQRRVNAEAHDAMTNFAVLGVPVPQSVKDACGAINTKCALLCAMSPIPSDYTDDKYWT